MADDSNSELEELKIDRQLHKHHSLMSDAGNMSQKVGRDPRFSAVINFVWATIGSVAVIIGIGVYNKLSSINDTLIQAVSDIKNQAQQVSDLKNEVRDLRTSQIALQRQVDSLEGKTLRGIEEITRGK